jgi:hypothetical protein
VNGLELARRYYREAVAPIVERVRPGLRHTAGLFGHCSDVLGFDDELSRDHGWGPRCVLLLEADGFAASHAALNAALAAELPLRFCGHPTSFRNLRLDPIDAPPVRHWVDMWTQAGYLEQHLGITRPTELTAAEWLRLPPHELLNATSGELFRDDLGFGDWRRALGFYPDDVRLYLLCAEWIRIGDEQEFAGRAGSVGDELGSRILAARLAERLMRIGFHLERRYAPYSKWLGTAFQRLPGSSGLSGALSRMLAGPDWQSRDAAWTEALAEILRLHEAQGLLAIGKYRVGPVYLGRPGSGLPGIERGPASMASLLGDLRAQIRDPEARALAEALEPA